MHSSGKPGGTSPQPTEAGDDPCFKVSTEGWIEGDAEESAFSPLPVDPCTTERGTRTRQDQSGVLEASVTGNSTVSQCPHS